MEGEREGRTEGEREGGMERERERKGRECVNNSGNISLLYM